MSRAIEYTPNLEQGVVEDLAVKAAKKATGFGIVIEAFDMPHKIREIWQNRQLTRYFRAQASRDTFNEGHFVDNSINRAAAKVLMQLSEEAIRAIYTEPGQAEWILNQRNKAKQNDGIIDHLERFNIANGREIGKPFLGVLGLGKMGKIGKPFEKTEFAPDQNRPERKIRRSIEVSRISPLTTLLERSDTIVTREDGSRVTVGELIREEAVGKARNFLDTLRLTNQNKSKGLDNTNVRIAINAIAGTALSGELGPLVLNAVFTEAGIKVTVPTLLTLLGVGIPNLPWLLPAVTLGGIGIVVINLTKNITERSKNDAAKALYARRSNDYSRAEDNLQELVSNRLVARSAELVRNKPIIAPGYLDMAKMRVAAIIKSLKPNN